MGPLVLRQSPKMSHRRLMRLNHEQDAINSELGQINLSLAKQLEDLRLVAKNALEHRFSPHTWHKALVLIRGNVEDPKQENPA